MSSQKNKSLIDGLEVLRFLSAAGTPVGCREMSRRLNMEPTRVNRLLMTLKEIGLASQNENRKYIPGSGVHILAAQCLNGSKLLNATVKVLGKIKKREYTVALGVLWRDTVSYLLHSGINQELIQGIGTGPSLYPAITSSIGRVLLANESAEYIDKHYADKENVNLKKLKKELSTIKKQGYAIVDNNVHLNVAIPVNAQTEAALSFTTIPRDTDTDMILDKLRSITAEISKNISNDN